tara:strand:- start:4072 stop:4419 length:348 start_codon:yes stop_codon:yes gene_type:complete
MAKSTWDKVMAMKENDTRHRGVANTLRDDEIDVLLGLVGYFGGSVRQASFDLRLARYRIFDWIAMCVMGNRAGSQEATKILVYSFLKNKGDIDKFIEDLRHTDYEVNRKWEKIKL